MTGSGRSAESHWRFLSRGLSTRPVAAARRSPGVPRRTGSLAPALLARGPARWPLGWSRRGLARARAVRGRTRDARLGVSPMHAAAENVQALAFLILFLVLTVVVWRSFGAAYGLFAAVSLAIPLSYPSSRWPLLSLPRFGLVVFPFFLALAALTAGRPRRTPRSSFAAPSSSELPSPSGRSGSGSHESRRARRGARRRVRHIDDARRSGARTRRRARRTRRAAGDGGRTRGRGSRDRLLRAPSL